MADSRNVRLLLLLASLCQWYLAKTGGLRAALDDAFGALAKKTLEEYEVPGASVVVGYGHAVLPSTRAANRTLYYIGSISNSFTAASLPYLFETTANTTSPIHLHTPHVLAHPLRLRPVRRLRDAARDHRRPARAPDGPCRSTTNRTAAAGSAASKSITLAHVLETATGGVPLGDDVERAVFEPLGMRHAYASRDKARRTGRAHGSSRP
ncbi:hypothetical protein IWZ03DRAFT_406075 [Phyllosticta citriasiana]|uniref:Beta-lactamase-related domain-containing protein n=1 Tax=Phyllosticta citriasiana TaxID=595635 RepID=A0ABR1KLX9_9PEZI